MRGRSRASGELIDVSTGNESTQRPALLSESRADQLATAGAVASLPATLAYDPVTVEDSPAAGGTNGSGVGLFFRANRAVDPSAAVSGTSGDG